MTTSSKPIEGTLDELLPDTTKMEIFDQEVFEDQRYTVTIYRDDSVTSVAYRNVKHVFMTCDNTILTIAQYTNDGSHRYINWLREHFVWYRVERQEEKEGASK